MIFTKIHLKPIYKPTRSAIEGALFDNKVRMPFTALLKSANFVIDCRTLLRDITILTRGEHKEVQVPRKGRSVRKSISLIWCLLKNSQRAALMT